MRQRVLTFLTPSAADILFYETVDAQRVGSQIPEYGTPHPDTDRWPDHELVFVKTSDPQGLFYQYFYAARRENQDDYNYEIQDTRGGTALTRTYVIPRHLYLARRADEVTGTPIVGEFFVPEAATLDSVFPKFGFASDSLIRTETELDSRFVVVQRQYLPPVRRDVRRDEELEADILIERHIIPKNLPSGDVEVSGPGVTVERDDANIFHDLLTITRYGDLSIDGDGNPVITPFTYPRQLASLPSDSNYPFPLLLRGVSIEAAWAVADSAEAARAYDEAWYFAYDLVEPAPGPYEARILRFLTDDPNELTTSYTVDTPPATPREVIGIASWWAYASNKGNSAFAEAREEVIPSSIHDALTVDLNGIQALSDRLSTTQLAATPGFQEFVSRRSMVIGYEPRKTRYGLYEIRVIELNCTGIYGGAKVPLGSVEGDGGNTGGTIPGTTVKPNAPSVTISADNTTVSGTTYPNAQVTIVDSTNAAVVGRATADSTGVFSAALTTEYLDAVALTATVRYNSQTSFPATVTTNDLTPAAPTGYLNGAGTSLNGVAQAGSTVNITYSTKQVETVTVVGTVSSDGDLTVTVDSGLWVGSEILTVPVLNGQSASTVAGLIVTAMIANGNINGNYVPAANGADVTLTARIAAADDAALAIAITGALGISGSFSSTTTAGVAPATVTTTAHATTGAYSYTFSPALAVGSTVVVSATDAAGTGPALTLTVNASPPTLTSATFPDSTSITGVSSAGAVVRAYLNGTQIGSDTADGSGNFDITVASLIRGEVVTVIAELASDSAVKSASRTATAPDLDLEVPTLTYTSAGWIGVIPAGADEIVYYLSSGGPETVVTPFANGNFTFNLPTFLGEEYLVVARYPEGDSDPVQINAQDIPRDPIRIIAAALSSGYSSAYFNNVLTGYYGAVNGLIGVQKSGYTSWLVRSGEIGDDGVFVFVPYEAGVSVQFTFPGQALNTITHSPSAANYGLDYRYKLGVAPLTGMSSSSLPTLMNVIATYSDGRSVTASFDRANMSFKYVAI